MKTGDRDRRIAELGAGEAADETADALDRLLAESRIGVAPSFTRQVMSGLPEASWQRRRAARAEWLIAAAAASVLVVVAAVLLTGGDAAEPGVGGSVVDLVVATVMAGAGFLAASWRGIGTAVSAALDGSVTAMAALGLAALAANGLLVLLLRRRRSAARIDDES